VSFFRDRPLFVLEMANNHMGSVEHGKAILRAFAEVVAPFSKRFRFGFKFQYRDLATFIHPAYRDRQDIKYVKRFRETELREEQFLELKAEMESLGFLSVCTPFDEISAARVERHGYAVVKIASCSFTDWPLLERVVGIARPIMLSTAGASLEDLDRVVAFLEHRNKDFALMHCVAMYPTRLDALSLHQIRFLEHRYPKTVIGYSTHEPPSDFDAVRVAVGAGARIFEKHVGLATDQYKLNEYSASPAQVAAWLRSAAEAFAEVGVEGTRPDFDPGELASLHDLRRGLWLARDAQAGERLQPADFTLAIPLQPGQLTANDLSKYAEHVLLEDRPAGSPLLASHVQRTDHRERVRAIMQRVKSLLKDSAVLMPKQADIEISHHYGIERFEEFGTTLVTVVNRAYCKKLIVVLPGQKHPEQWHDKKEETFHVLHGRVDLVLDGEARACEPGDVVTVERGVRHAFSSTTGAVMEEISSTHFVDDSHYTDESIAKNKNRKTLVTYWID
jgi:sialic acid synthase SpsE/quercetin dioxygenase-like cupin family protein